jgi:hypothetical protein
MYSNAVNFEPVSHSCTDGKKTNGKNSTEFLIINRHEMGHGLRESSALGTLNVQRGFHIPDLAVEREDEVLGCAGC